LGMGTRSAFLSVTGFRPRPAFRMAVAAGSSSCTAPAPRGLGCRTPSAAWPFQRQQQAGRPRTCGSKMATHSVWASRTDTCATDVSGTVLPNAGSVTESSRSGGRATSPGPLDVSACCAGRRCRVPRGRTGIGGAHTQRPQVALQNVQRLFHLGVQRLEVKLAQVRLGAVVALAAALAAAGWRPEGAHTYTRNGAKESQ